ncbi:MAG TPA: MASE1 domain-containing protein [Candidatus Binatia bacterium]|nr:MASE1 domain-containing protein [Candidatus Binatia bacterium]
MSQPLKRLLVVVALAFVYLVAAKLGLSLAFVHASATAVWPGTGIALAAILILGYGAWPGILLGAFLANVTTAGSVATSIGIAVGNTLEGLLGAYLVNRFANGRKAFDRASDIFRLAFLAAGVSTTVSVTVGVTSLFLGGFARSEDFAFIWLTWWLGDAMGCLIIAPLLVLWSENPRIRWNRSQILEAAWLLSCLFLVGLIVFDGLIPIKNYPLEFLCVPFLIWVAFRFGQREAATAIVVLSGIAIWGTLSGFGPFVGENPNESLLLLQAFMGVTAVMTLVLAAVVSERRQVEGQLRDLSVTDPLTGLANYRQLIHVLDGEIKRSQRTERQFAILFLDVDSLKKINDRHGHVVGNRALRRVADALRTSCRAMDTVGRFGGDEFALILPETEEVGARQVAHRIAQRLAREGATPRIAVSTGVAVYPRDGKTIEALLSAADSALYDVKSRVSRLRTKPGKQKEEVGEDTTFQNSADAILSKRFTR